MSHISTINSYFFVHYLYLLDVPVMEISRSHIMVFLPNFYTTGKIVNLTANSKTPINFTQQEPFTMHQNLLIFLYLIITAHTFALNLHSFMSVFVHKKFCFRKLSINEPRGYFLGKIYWFCCKILSFFSGLKVM